MGFFNVKISVFQNEITPFTTLIEEYRINKYINEMSNAVLLALTRGLSPKRGGDACPSSVDEASKSIQFGRGSSFISAPKANVHFHAQTNKNDGGITA